MRRRDRCRNAAAREDAFFRRATRESRGKRAKRRERQREEETRRPQARRFSPPTTARVPEGGEVANWETIIDLTP
ncbi:hypothetical protein ALC57_15976 [Trachymyrmex cornetzi]|uniref:Uncharacterized protein n=1 Tax=Trachymyrmex cornetzi TaxID=471704 RepID=A0A195DG17_9HYME|nr:hypothetical protein ALC57_15976 [Trachymyrmex cornetzi]